MNKMKNKLLMKYKKSTTLIMDNKYKKCSNNNSNKY